MTSPTEQRRAFDTAMDSYRTGDRDTALTTFTRITAVNASMSDAWLGRLACGDQDLDTLAGAHEHSRALYRETRRIGVRDGELHEIKSPIVLQPGPAALTDGVREIAPLEGRHPAAGFVILAAAGLEGLRRKLLAQSVERDRPLGREAVGLEVLEVHGQQFHSISKVPKIGSASPC